MAHEFTSFILVLGGLIAVSSYSAQTDQNYNTFILLGLMGQLILVAISVDLLSTHSAKVALRMRLEELEQTIGLAVWSKTIAARKRTAWESWFKPIHRDRDEVEIDYFQLSVFASVGLWIVLTTNLIHVRGGPTLYYLGVALGIILIPRLSTSFKHPRN